MKKYRVILQAKSENGLVGVRFFDNDAVIEFEEFDKDNNEIYSIETEYNVDRVLDLSEAVIEYETGKGEEDD